MTTLDARDTLSLLRELDDRERQPLTLGNRTHIADLQRELRRRSALNNQVDPVTSIPAGGAR